MESNNYTIKNGKMISISQLNVRDEWLCFLIAVLGSQHDRSDYWNLWEDAMWVLQMGAKRSEIQSIHWFEICSHCSQLWSWNITTVIWSVCDPIGMLCVVVCYPGVISHRVSIRYLHIFIWHSYVKCECDSSGHYRSTNCSCVSPASTGTGSVVYRESDFTPVRCHHDNHTVTACHRCFGVNAITQED